MDERMVSVMWDIDNALDANKVFYWTLPWGATLWHVSAVASNDSDATLMIGDSGDTDQAMAAAVIGDSGTPVEYDFADFTSPHFVEGDVFTATVDYDGSSGTAAEDMQVVFTFLVG